MEENNIKEVHFDIDLGWLLNFYLNKQYEKMTDENHDRIYKSVYIYPLWDLIQETDDEQLKFSLDKYFKEEISVSSGEVNLTPEILELWSAWQMNEFESRDKEIKDAKYKIALIKSTGSYVHDRKTGEYVACEFGEHANAVRQIIKRVFGVDDIYSHIDLWPEFDDYIMENLELKGTYFSDGHYLIDQRPKQQNDDLQYPEP